MKRLFDNGNNDNDETKKVITASDSSDSSDSEMTDSDESVDISITTSGEEEESEGSESDPESEEDENETDRHKRYIQREQRLKQELAKEHDINIEPINETDLTTTGEEGRINGSSSSSSGTENRLGCSMIKVHNIINMHQLSYNDIDIYLVAKKGALFGMRYVERNRERSFIMIRYRGTVKHIIFKSGIFIESGGHSPLSKEKALQQTLALLRHVCGLTGIVIKGTHCQNMVTATRLDKKLSRDKINGLCKSLKLERLEWPLIVIPYVKLPKVDTLDKNTNNIRFLLYANSGSVLCVGGRLMDSVVEAHTKLLETLSPHIITVSNKKRRF